MWALLPPILALVARNCTVGGIHSECLSTGCCANPKLACFKRPSMQHAECLPREPNCVDTADWLCPGWELCGKRRGVCQRSQCCENAEDECCEACEARTKRGGAACASCRTIPLQPTPTLPPLSRAAAPVNDRAAPPCALRWSRTMQIRSTHGTHSADREGLAQV